MKITISVGRLWRTADSNETVLLNDRGPERKSASPQRLNLQSLSPTSPPHESCIVAGKPTLLLRDRHSGHFDGTFPDRAPNHIFHLSPSSPRECLNEPRPELTGGDPVRWARKCDSEGRTRIMAREKPTSGCFLMAPLLLFGGR